tara:strand:- start:371 stop:475 length:105 start_codon:yes stop_codon:yes gene_type:complete
LLVVDLVALVVELVAELVVLEKLKVQALHIQQVL